MANVGCYSNGTKQEKANVHKHGVSFELAGSVFRDAAIATYFDAGYSETEDRFSVGRAARTEINGYEESLT